MRTPALLLAAVAVSLVACADDQQTVSIDSVPPTLRSRVQAPTYTRPAKNVIVFIGDGMGVSTITAGRIYDGQRRGVDGESNALHFEALPHTALIKTYNTNQQVSDSAGTATAMFTGTKTRAGVISIGPQADRQDCAGALAHPLTTLWERAEARGLATGIVTSARLTHATPAALYAHSPERNWEDDKYLPESAQELGCRDIATQLMEPARGDGPEVALGGGSANFLPRNDGGRRRDQRDLIAEWVGARADRQVVRSADELSRAASSGQLFGVFASSHLPYELERDENTTAPSLRQMTEAALDRLQQSSQGYFLMVEGGRIDHAHHAGVAGLALAEVVAFDEAVDAALARVDLEDTLVLVTADHSHVFTIAGYPTRNNPILGLVVGNDATGNPRDTPTLAADGQPFTTLGYMNGPGAVDALPRPRPNFGSKALQQALIPTGPAADLSETHAGEDVVLFAGGPWAHLARGVMEQDLIYDLIVMAYGWPLED